ncbi:MAG TPA: hypothetical protein VGG39_27150 [Polyangiaceae bacterium]|jgi:hypothetical protein
MPSFRACFIAGPVLAAGGLVSLLAASACGGGTANPAASDAGPDVTSGPGSDGAPPGSDGGGAPAPDSGVSCPPPDADSGVYGAENPASGTVSGPDVACTFCNAGASVFVESYATFPTMTYLDLQDGTFVFTSPTTASDARVSGIVQIAAAAPGTYTSSDPTNCGSVSLSYVLPVPPGVDCGDGSILGPTCPPGCGSACSGFGCSPCAPNPPEGFYLAQGGATCFEETEPAVGSWSITLTSVEPYAGDAGLAQGRVNYVAHGSLTAQLVGGDAPDGGDSPATLTLAF